MKKLSSGRVTSLPSTEPWPMELEKYWRCSKRSCPARLTSEGDEVIQQTNGHNHAIDGVEAQVERVNHNLRSGLEKRSHPSIYNDALVDIATNSEENEALAGSLPTFPSLKSLSVSQK